MVVETGRAEDCGPSERIVADARLAAKERAKSRSKITTELFSEQSTGIIHDISAAEVNYEVWFLYCCLPQIFAYSYHIYMPYTITCFRRFLFLSELYVTIGPNTNSLQN